ncbi:M48 family metallopeptidase [Flavobacterium sp.]|uniref:M48 family metallopeptidase n=1 Tax=Flavobacterium sp. TaxID=239 RepID=UPI00262C48BB|nr:M48 family metallopeptidase [Flavobacterium sp.]
MVSKKHLFKFKYLFILFFIATSSFGQKTYEDEGTVTQFKSPFNVITLMVGDDETEYLINEDTSFPKKIEKEDIKIGQKIGIKYFLDNRDYVLKEITVKSNKIDENINFTGLFEFVDSDIAYVDGKKIKLTDKGTLECPGKKLFSRDCGCEKVKPYRGFDDKNIRMGSYFNITGKLDKDGIIQASKISVCRNGVSEDEITLRNAIENSYDASGLLKVKAPTGFNATNGLYQGNIKIGALEYKLLDNIKVQGYVNLVGNRIIPQYAQEESFKEANNIIYRFYVIENSIPNAFAYPNGMVFIHTGLLKIIENEAQLALVLGHEIAHVLYEHSVDRYKKSKKLDGGIAKSGLRWFNKKLGLDKSNDNSVFSASLNNLTDKIAPENLSGLFEKTKETQADRIGLLYMYMAGYDLREAPKFWLKMKTVSGDASYQQKINKTANGLLESKDLDIEKGLLSQLGSKGMDAVSNSLLENIYASHPLASQRYDDINELMTIYYKDIDFTKALVGDGDYKKYLGGIK